MENDIGGEVARLGSYQTGIKLLAHYRSEKTSAMKSKNAEKHAGYLVFQVTV